MRRASSYLAGRRCAGVGLALLVELLALVALSLGPPSATIGIPAAVAAAIGGTVAVVFGVADGVLVATAGAIVFAALGGWGAGELAAIGVWPLIVAAVGLFAHRVERYRVTLHQLVDAHEDERRALALTLHDDSAQTLTGALLTLRAASAAGEPGTTHTAEARELINDTIQQLRRLALELSPKALEDYGLAAAIGHLAESTTINGGAGIAFQRDWDGRLSAPAESALFRFAQAALAAIRECSANPIMIRLGSERGRVAVTVAADGNTAAAAPPSIPAALVDRVRLLGGRVSATGSGRGELVLHADVPCKLLTEPAGGVV